MQKFILSFVFLLAFALTTLAQNFKYTPIKIQWGEPQLAVSEDISVKRLYFNNAVYENNLPYLNIELCKGKAFNINFENIEYVDCNSEETALLSNEVLSTEGVSFKEFYYKESNSTELSILPITRINGELKKIVSAQIKYEIGAGLRASSSGQVYADNSVLASGEWVKIAVSKSGIHKLTYDDIVNMGISNPEGVRIYGYGGATINESFAELFPHKKDDLPENAIYMNKGNDGIFNAGDYILFYAQGTVKVLYDENDDLFDHEVNPYSNLGYYFVSSRNNEGKRIATAEVPPIRPMIEVDKTRVYEYHESEEVNLISSGREWYGDQFSMGNTQHTINFSIPNVTTDNATIMAEAVNVSSSSATISVKLAQSSFNSTIYMYGITNSHQGGRPGLISEETALPSSGNITFTLNYSQPTSTSYAYLNYLRINATRDLVMYGSEMQICYPGSYMPYYVADYTIKNANADLSIWEITDQQNIRSYATTHSDNTVNYLASYDSLRTYIALYTNGDFAKPQIIGKVANQNLHAWGQTDMVIISPTEFNQASEKLAQHHRDYDNLNVKVIDPQQIYNEFSSGTPDATAYRLFMKMLYDKANGDTDKQPKYLLFMGISGYDNRGITREKLDLLSYQSEESLIKTSSYTTDDYYGMIYDNSFGYKNISGNKMAIAIGRLPVRTATEANQCVNKTINYVKSSQYGTWRNEWSYLADDGDANIHVEQANEIADTLLSKNGAFKTNRVYLDAYPIEQTASGSSYPKATEAIHRYLNDGTLVFTYFGHGSTSILTSEQTITMSDINNMTNNNLALWITATCDFSRYDDYELSAGMQVVLNPNGGGISMLTTTRSVFSNDNFKLVKNVYEYILPTTTQPALCLGDIVKNAKNAIGYNSNKLNFCLLGDPAITLKYPKQNIITDSINGQNPEDAIMQALGIVTLKGSILDTEDNIDENFNGIVNITIFDKQSNLETLANKGGNKFQYKDYINILFNGKVEVIDGKFETIFMVPKDIKYNIDNAKILYYAYTDEGNDAHGMNIDFRVGGSDPSATPAETGPDIRMYINTTNFKDGDKVNPNPVLYAHLYDNYGINVIGAGIGHDISMKINNDTYQTYTLNDYYESTLNDYKSGFVKYQFSDLENGNYHIDFKAWNLQNISNTSSLNFVVDNKANPSIEEFYSYPNPATTESNIVLKYDRPENLISLEFYLYDLVGNKYWSSKADYNSAEGIYTAKCDLTQGIGGKYRPGIYILQAKITTKEGTTTNKSQKIIVAPQ